MPLSDEAPDPNPSKLLYNCGHMASVYLLEDLRTYLIDFLSIQLFPKTQDIIERIW